MKYVIFLNDEFVLIPEHSSHDKFIDFEPVSAGFCRVESYKDTFGDVKYKVSCWGQL